MSAEEAPTPVVEVVAESTPVSSPPPPPPIVEEVDDIKLPRWRWNMLLQSCSAEKTGIISACQLKDKLRHLKTKELKQRLDYEREVRNWRRRNDVEPVISKQKKARQEKPRPTPEKMEKLRHKMKERQKDIFKKSSK